VGLTVGVAVLCLLVSPGRAAGQELHDAAPAAAAAPQAPAGPALADEHGMPADAPTLHIRGFTDLGFAETDHDEAVPSGFSVGQFVLHLSSSLGHKVSFFGETSFTARSNTYTVEVERVILRYDYNDHLKISVGRYHTPINYWNTTYHHGLWLQTTIDRPEMIKSGGTFQPVHFVGLLAEGLLTSPTLGLGYNAGVGNGRGDIISRAGDAGDVNTNRAWVAKLYSRPAALYGLELGTAVYHDLVPVANTPGYPELIASAYVALTRETPEVIAEFSHVRHHDQTADVDYTSHAFYVQVAARMPQAPKWKPYTRFEQLSGNPEDPVFGDLDTTIATAGLRYELTDLAAIKGEYRHTRRAGEPHVNGVYAQVAFTFGD
jgi:hypothetical protein